MDHYNRKSNNHLYYDQDTYHLQIIIIVLCENDIIIRVFIENNLTLFDESRWDLTTGIEFRLDRYQWRRLLCDDDHRYLYFLHSNNEVSINWLNIIWTSEIIINETYPRLVFFRAYHIIKRDLIKSTCVQRGIHEIV